MKQQWAVASAEECYSRLGPNAILSAEGYCNATWDTILCWGAAKSNTTVYLPCPALNGLDPNKFAYRHCGPEGLWQGKEAGDYSRPVGYTFYGGCYTKEAYELYTKYLNLKLIKDIAGTGRTLELVGLSVSLVSTLLSLAIFCYFRGLKCHRTRIHKNLFVAIVVQITMRIILCVDQYIARKTGGEVAGASSGSSSALYDKAVFCEILYALLEYTKTVKFMWMFVEGLYLHNMIAVSVFSGKPNYIVFYSLGWGFPVLLLVAWIVPMTQLHKVKCWFAYYYNPLIWILEGPRGAVMAINLAFLLNIIRVLVMKLRESRTNEAKRVRKAVKAAIVLLPLLGLTNFAIMLEPVGDDHVHLSVWMFSTLFLTDLEGFFISLIYCFLNGEVQTAVRRQLFGHMPSVQSMDLSTSHWRNTTLKVRAALSRQLETWRHHRFINSSSLRRLSRSLSAFTSFSEVTNTAQNQRNSQVASESKSVVNGVQKEFNGRTPSLRFYNRRFSMRRSYSLSACNSSLQVTEPLRAGQLQEQEI